MSVVSVDDGNREKVGLSRMRPLEEKFSKLPCQGMCCALSGIRPVHPTPEKKSGMYVNIKCTLSLLCVIPV